LSERALVVLSGGQDSTTCLYWAIDKFSQQAVSSITFDYGQRHRLEIDCARRVADLAGIANTLLPIDTFRAPAGIDWLCISPKAGADVVQRSGNELKLVYPQSEPEAQPRNFVGLEFEHFLLQPLDDTSATENTRAAIDFCLQNPRWKLSLQTHKITGIA